MTKTAFAALAALALSACTPAPGPSQSQENFRQTPVTEDFATGRVSWRADRSAFRGGPASYNYAYRAVVRDGEIEICGAGSYSRKNDISETMSVMRDAVVLLDGQVIMKDMRFFNDVGPATGLTGKMANCRKTGVDFPGGSPEIAVTTFSKTVLR